MTYLDSLKEILARLDEAQARAELEVPASIRREHRQLALYAPAAWEALRWKYPNSLPIDALGLIVEARTKLQGFFIRAQGHAAPPDLTLVRRSPDGLVGHVGGGEKHK